MINIEDPITIILSFPENSSDLKTIFKNQKDKIKLVTKKPVFIDDEVAYNVFYSQSQKVKDYDVIVTISLGSV